MTFLNDTFGGKCQKQHLLIRQNIISINNITSFPDFFFLQTTQRHILIKLEARQFSQEVQASFWMGLVWLRETNNEYTNSICNLLCIKAVTTKQLMIYRRKIKRNMTHLSDEIQAIVPRELFYEKYEKHKDCKISQTVKSF